MKKYPYTGPIEASMVTSFVGEVLGGRVAPHLKSEEVKKSKKNGKKIELY